MDDARITVAGDGDHMADDPRDELLEAAEAALAWLYDRRAHMMPEEMMDGREGGHRRRLLAAIRRARGTAA